MDWLCPSYNQALSDKLIKYSGNGTGGTLTPAITIAEILPIVQTGDVHALVYDLTDQIMYVSFYQPNATHAPPNTPNIMAYDRQFTQLDLNALFSEAKPVAAAALAA